MKLLLRKKDTEYDVKKILGEGMCSRIKFIIGDLTDIDLLVKAA